jgi:hypothetical protein
MVADAAPSRRAAVEWAVVALLAAAVTLPFLGKACHIEAGDYLIEPAYVDKGRVLVQLYEVC